MTAPGAPFATVSRVSPVETVATGGGDVNRLG
jgi:hypothetical protein